MMIKPASRLPHASPMGEASGQTWHLHILARVGLLTAIALGLLVRAAHILSTDFPLNDGGLFYLMVQELQQAHYSPPAFTSYNHAGIPFAYSPFGLYVAAALDDLTPMSLEDVFRFLPLAVNVLIIGAFVLLARSLLASDAGAVAAVVAFALVPRSFIWLLMGGGVARSFGFLFAILALHQLHAFYTSGRWRCVATATVWVALTALSHIGTVSFLMFSGMVFLLFFGRRAQAVLGSLVIGLGSLALTAPWWLTVIKMHGVGPFLAAGASSSSIFSNAEALRGVLALLAHLGIGTSSGAATGESLFPILGTLALFGLLSAVVSREPFLPIWWIVIILMDARAGMTYATLPLAMLAGLGIVRVLFPLLNLSTINERSFTSLRAPLSRALPNHSLRISFGVLGLLLVYCTVSAAIVIPGINAQTRAVASLSKESREAMEWIKTSTPPSSVFVVLPENIWGPWEMDKTSEWFPTLTGRTNLATVQGSEWLPDHAFLRLKASYKELRECAGATLPCIEDWAIKTGSVYTHIYIPQPPLPANESHLLCCKVLIPSLQADSRYDMVYHGPGGLVFAKR
jgi:hypothetical protein